MLNFKPLEISDRDYLMQYYRQNISKSSLSCFGTMYAWNAIYPKEFIILYDTLIYKSIHKNNIHFSFPIGGSDDDKISAVKQIIGEYPNDKVKLTNINESEKKLIEAEFPGMFELSFNADYSDYVYEKEKLEFLKGKKLHSKRNHINKFMIEYAERFTTEKITQDNIDECRNMSLRWCRDNDCINSLELTNEACAVKRFLKHYFELDLYGLILRIDGKVAAFSFGEQVCDDTLVVHVEKALQEYQGAYTVINNMFVKEYGSDFMYINREEDVGDEGLRKAKSSYKPDLMVDKYDALNIKL